MASLSERAISPAAQESSTPPGPKSIPSDDAGESSLSSSDYVEDDNADVTSSAAQESSTPPRPKSLPSDIARTDSSPRSSSSVEDGNDDVTSPQPDQLLIAAAGPLTTVEANNSPKAARGTTHGSPKGEPRSLNQQYPRNASGESRFYREDEMMKQQVAADLAAGFIDEEQAARLSVPWHAKGWRDNTGRWDEKYLDPTKRETSYVMMSYEQAMRIQRRKDKAQEKWLADWRAGIIDDNGNKITDVSTSSSNSASDGGEEKEDKEEEGTVDVDDAGLNLEAGSSDTEAIPVYPPKDVALSTMLETSEQPSSPPVTTQKPPLSLNLTSAEPEPRLVTIDPRKDADSRTSREASEPLSRASRASPNTNTKLSLPRKRTSTTPAKAPSTKAVSAQIPEAGKIVVGKSIYDDVHYYELVAECRKRGLASGGGTEMVRARLVTDDIEVRDGKDRTGIRKSKPTRKSRPYKHEAPTLPVTVKRKRGEDEVGQGEEKKTKLD